MDEPIIEYLQRLELLAFFSGYPLLYAVVVYISGSRQSKSDTKKKMAALLPFAYALTGALYIGLQLKNWYPHYAVSDIQQPVLVLWAFLSVLFFVPALAKKIFISLLHSFIFFFFLLKDILIHLFTSASDNTILQNDMKVYTDSLLVNLFSFVLVAILYYLLVQVNKYKNSSRLNR